MACICAAWTLLSSLASPEPSDDACPDGSFITGRGVLDVRPFFISLGFRLLKKLLNRSLRKSCTDTNYYAKGQLEYQLFIYSTDPLPPQGHTQLGHKRKCTLVTLYSSQNFTLSSQEIAVMLHCALSASWDIAWTWSSVKRSLCRFLPLSSSSL